mgnify:CR=1 FL=1
MILSRTREVARRYGWNFALRALLLSLLRESSKYVDYNLFKLKRLLLKTIKASFQEFRIEVYPAKISLKLCGEPIETELLVAAFDSGLSRDLLMYGIREPIHTITLYRIIKEAGLNTVLDIGSNIGYFPKIELMAGAKRIIAFEPVPFTYAILRINLANHPECAAINAAVAERRGKTAIYVPLDEEGHPILNMASLDKNVIRKSRVKSLLEQIVPCYRFQEVLDHHNPDAIRMDIEGYEWRLFTSLEYIPSKTHLIDFEVHSGDIRTVRKTFIFLEREGFANATVIVNPHLPIFWIRTSAKIIGMERTIKGYNRLRLSTTGYPFINPITKVKLAYLIKNIKTFLRRTGDVQILLERRN